MQIGKVTVNLIRAFSPGHTDDFLAAERVDETGLANVGMTQGANGEHTLFLELTFKQQL